MKLYTDFNESLSNYWKTYGGYKAVVKSPFFHLALVISLITYPVWTGKVENVAWYNLPISILPDLLGFTLGGYAILLTFGDERFRKLLTGQDPDGTPSPYMDVNAAFIHFIICQINSLIYSVISICWAFNTGFFAWFGMLLFIYALSTSGAAAFAVYTLAKLYDKVASNDDK